MAFREISAEERRARLAARHHLSPGARTDDIASMIDDVVALHSSDPVSVYLSATARMASPSIAAVSAALYDDRSVVRLHAMRRTLWVATPEVARLAHAAATTKLVAPERRRLVKLLEDNGISDGETWLDRARTHTLDALDSLGEATTRELGDAVPELRHPLELSPGKSYGQTVSAHTRVLTLLGFEAEVVRTRPVGSWVSGQYRWAHTAKWVPGGIDGDDPRDAAAALAHRWLHAFGPAPASDLQWWTGWTKGFTATALDDSTAVPVSLDGTDAWLARDDLEPVTDAEPWVAFLPSLDPATMGWKDRSWYLDDSHAGAVFDRNGNGGATIWVDGRIAGSWAQRPDGVITYVLFEALPKRRRGEVETAAEALRTLLADTRISMRFPAPVQRQLLDSQDSRPAVSNQVLGKDEGLMPEDP